MKDTLYRNILWFITVMIALTIVTQGFYLYLNYKESKNRLIQDVQISLDQAVEDYYATLTEQKMGNFILTHTKDSINDNKFPSFFRRLDSLETSHNQESTGISLKIDLTDSTANDFEMWSFDNDHKGDTIFDFIDSKKLGDRFTKFPDWHSKTDSIFIENPIARLTSRVIFGLTQNNLNLIRLDTLVATELDRKKVNIDYDLSYINADNVVQKTERIANKQDMLTAQSKATVLNHDSALKIEYTNISGTLFRKNAFNILLSFLFVGGIIACLLYLLRVIKNQKQLAEIKNDLISNITHEFKTPIATIGAAMEGIKVFNTDNNTEKTLKYANISATQVDKLNGMVEKLLETASLDSERLKLNFEETDLIQLLDTIGAKELFSLPDKTISFTTTEPVFNYPIDRFHFENAINNIVDNALKYGGNTIEISLTKLKESIVITIADNGSSLTTTQSKQIFDKFYRVPKGNTHDIKGFGIGLYYTKAIIEKHQGNITVDVKPTTFKIILPL